MDTKEQERVIPALLYGRAAERALDTLVGAIRFAQDKNGITWIVDLAGKRLAAIVPVSIADEVTR